ncbi:MAG: hypothetical protein INR73_28110 [Williamsia sp.]|nr:hypothetical protein [Williamsia sp.]
MLQFIVLAYDDATDPFSLERRMDMRPLHLEGAAKLRSSNNFIIGGAFLDEAGRMTGSMMIVQFETEEALHEWLRNEPYVTGKVWHKIEVKPFRVADV